MTHAGVHRLPIARRRPVVDARDRGDDRSRDLADRGATETERRLSVGKAMSDSAWTADDPQPGDFDAEIATIEARYVELRDGSSGGRLRIVLSFEGEDAARLERTAAARGQTPGQVVADLLRDADRSAA
jgi:hypothetical protein